MAHKEPPSATSSIHQSLFQIGRDSHGNWVAQDQDHIRGGLFVDRLQALRFIRRECGTEPDAIIMVPGVLELDLSRPGQSGERALRPANDDDQSVH